MTVTITKRRTKCASTNPNPILRTIRCTLPDLHRGPHWDGAACEKH
jgi:hypothetical protein